MSDKDLGSDLLSIKEFAELVGMTVEALRHYDRKGIFHPAQRGVEFENQYRYYAPTQIATVKMIRVLTEIGVPLKTIKELAKNRTPLDVMKLLSKHKDIVSDEIRFLQEVYTVINTFLELLNSGISATETDIFVSEMPEKRIILGDVNDYSGSATFYIELTHFCNTPHEPKLNLSYPVGGYFESMEEFLKEPSKPTRFFSLDPKGYESKAAGLYLTGYSRGYYGQINDLPQRLMAFAKKNGLEFDGPVYNIFLFDEMCLTDPDQYLLQVSATIKERRRVSSRRPIHRL